MYSYGKKPNNMVTNMGKQFYELEQKNSGDWRFAFADATSLDKFDKLNTLDLEKYGMTWRIVLVTYADDFKLINKEEISKEVLVQSITA